MTRSRKVIVLISSVCFVAGFLLAYEKEELIENEEGRQEITTKLKRSFFGRNQPAPEKEVSRITGSIKYDYAGFVAKLKGKLSPEDYEALFDEILLIKDFHISDRRMSLLLQRWAEVSPRQAMEKIRKHKSTHEWVYPVFESWARRNPEEAAAYYEESDDSNIKGNSSALSAIACQWAIHDPDRAWEWLHEQKGTGVFTEDFAWSRKWLVDTIAKAKSEQIPKLLEKLDVKTQEENAYVLAQNWPLSVDGLEEWISDLPEKGQSKALAGRIIAATQGDFQKIREEVSKLDKDKQSQVSCELATSVLENGGRDMGERVEWYLDTVPVESMPLSLRYSVVLWFEEDNGRFRQWADSLPEDEKTKVINLVNDLSVMKY